MRALTNLGLVEWCQGHERAAQQAFDRAIELSMASGGADLTTAHAHNNRGALRLSTGDADKAVLDFHTALGIDAWYEAARANRDRALVQLGEPAPLRPVEEMESPLESPLRHSSVVGGNITVRHASCDACHGCVWHARSDAATRQEPHESRDAENLIKRKTFSSHSATGPFKAP